MAIPEGSTRKSLRDTGCDVIEAANRRDAFVSAVTHRPSLVITETHLPGFDGFQLCEVLRRDSQTSSVPILIVTADARKSEADRARKAGADSVLIKPVTPEALLVEVQRLIGEPPPKPDTKNETAPSIAPAPSAASEGGTSYRDDESTYPTAATRLSFVRPSAELRAEPRRWRLE